ncbi:MAG: response regulator transcription factor [Luteolibacter sp.]
MKNPITVMLVEDNREYRDVVEFALSKEPGMELIADFSTAEIAIRSLTEDENPRIPDIILLDLNLPGMGGLEALPQFMRLVPSAKVMVLSNSDDKADVVSAISLGAQGYLLKSSRVDQILDGIHSVAAGGALLDPSVASFILDQIRPSSSSAFVDELDEALTERELEVLKYLGEGKVKKEIGDLLQISYFTVDSHVRNIYSKMRVSNAPAAINKAYRIRLFSPD